MKKILGFLMIGMLACSTCFASMVNMTKTGTNWIWKVEAGDERTFLRLESEDVWLTEDSKIVLIEGKQGEHLYNALLGQGWTVTDLPANIPQGLALVPSLAHFRGFMNLEAGDFILMEDGSIMRRDSVDPSPYSEALDRALVEDGTYLVNEDATNLRMER